MNFVRSLLGLSKSSPVSVDKVDFGNSCNEPVLNVVAEVDLETSSREITSKSTLSPTNVKLPSERTISSSIPKSADTIRSSSRRLPQYYGLGKMDRGNWVPKSSNGIKKTKYNDRNNLGYHMFKVWYVDLLEFEWEYRDYEELVESYPYLLPSCIDQIRLGFLPEAAPVFSSGAIKKGLQHVSNQDGAQPSIFLDQYVPFKSDTKFCVVYSFVDVMGMDKCVCDYIQKAIPHDETSLKELGSFLHPEGISLTLQHSGVDKVSWMTTSAKPGKYIVSGNGHTVGINVVSTSCATIHDPASRLPNKLLSKRSLEACLGKHIDEIRLIVDHRSKRAKFSNQLNTQASV